MANSQNISETYYGPVGIGSSVAISGNGATAAYASTIYATSNTVSVLNKSSSGWTKTDITNTPFKASSISISDTGNIIAVGSRETGSSWDLYYGTLARIGEVHLFSNNNGVVNLTSTINGIQEYANFGRSIALNAAGNILAVGAPDFATSGTYTPYSASLGNYAGSVSIYERIGNQWQKKGSTLFGNGGDRCGSSVALSSSGNRLAIGYPGTDPTYARGYVRVYEFINNDWQQIAAIPGDSVGDKFGNVVQLSSSGSVLAVGAPENDYMAFKGGQLKVFDVLSNGYVQIGQTIYGEGYGNQLSGPTGGASIGKGLAIDQSGENLAISHSIASGGQSGVVRFFSLINGQWIKRGQDISPPITGNYSYGQSLGVSNDFQTVIIGSPTYDPYSYANSSPPGLVQLYQGLGPNTTSCALLQSNNESTCQRDSVTLSLKNNVVNSSVFIDTIGQSISSNWSKVMATTPGKQYRLRIGGEFTYGTYCPSLVNDPAYSKPGFYGLTSPTSRSITNLSQGSSTIQQYLYVIGATINRPTPDVYNPNTHNYDYYFTATGTTIQVGWDDNCCLGDNCGSVGFALYEVQASPNILWSTGDTTASITVAPTSTTTYWVTDGNGCYDTVVVAVNNPNIQSSVSSVCGIGDSVLLWNTIATNSNNPQTNQPCTLPLNSLNSGLTGWYPFCGDANDASTIGNDGTVQGATLSTDAFGNANSAYSFNGQSSKIALDNPFFSGASNVSNFSIYTRFKIDALPQSQATIFSKEGFWRTIALIITADGEVNLRGSQPSPNGYFNFKSPINSIQPNQWYSVVYEFSNSTAKCYIDGNLVGTFSSPYSSFNWSYLQQGNSTSTTYFGVTHPVSPGLTNYFNGVIDDVGFWERSLTSGEIQSLSSVGSSTLTWSTGETGDSIWVKPTSTTTYTLTQSLGGASCSDSITISVDPIEITSAISVLCLGDSTVLTLNTNVLSGQSSVFWSTGDTTSSIKVAPISATSYSVTNGTGCTDTIQVDVNTTNFNVLPDSIISCSTDSILFQLSGYDSYMWSDGTTDSVNYLSNNAQGFHWVELAQGFCSSIDTSYMSLGNMKVDIGIAQEITCNSYYDGKLYVDVSGAQGPISILWSSQQTSDSISNLQAGTYWVQVIDSLGCIGSDTIILNQPVALSVNVVLDTINGFNLACQGDSTGFGYMVPSGGTLPYTYNWNVIPTVFDSTIHQLSQGNSKWAMVVDANGCFATDTFDVLAPTAFTANTLMLDSVSCFGGSDGSAYAMTFGGTGVNSYQWSNGSSSDTASSLMKGDYYLTATDSSGCNAIDTVQILEATEILTTTAVLTNHSGFAVPCAGDTTGQGVVSAIGGSGGYSFSWSTGSISDTVNNLSAGQYFVTVTDIKGCFKVDTLTLIEPDTFSVSVASDTNIFGNHVDCYLGQTAEIYSAVSGGAGAIQYSWSTSTPNSNDTLSNVGAGTYWLNIVDVNGCVSSDTIDLYEPSQLNVVTTVLSDYNGFDISCNGLSDGAINVSASGSNGGFSYAWSTGDTTTIVDSLSASTYFVIATDSLGCQSQELITLNQPTSLALSMSKSNFNGYDVSCKGSLDGFAHGLISGGVPSYGYAWNNISSSDSLTNIGVGSYVLMVTDSNGCQISDSITISEPDSLSIALSSTTNFNGYNVSCFGSSDGALASAITGGVPTYSFSWTLNGQSTGSQSVLSGQPSGLHQLNVEDVNGCVKQDSIYLSQPDSLITSSIVTSDYNGVAISCFDSSDGSAAVQVFGGVQPYQYTWNAGSPTVDSTKNDLFVGQNIVLITDANNCMVTNTVSLVGPDSLEYTSSISDILCHGDASGSVKIFPSGGVPLHTVQWAYQGFLADSLTSIPQGIYSFVITDLNGCQLEDSVEVFQAQEIITLLDTLPPSCYQIDDGVISLNTNGGFAPYSYVVNDSLVTLPLENIGVGQYWIEVIDSVGCSISLEVFMDPENEQCFNIPNLFSPNGDNYNDSWTIRVPKDYTYEVFIYNPLGQIIYQGTDSDPHWDGTGPNGPVANGDYYYAMIINSTEKIYGYVTVIR